MYIRHQNIILVTPLRARSSSFLKISISVHCLVSVIVFLFPSPQRKPRGTSNRSHRSVSKGNKPFEKHLQDVYPRDSFNSFPSTKSAIKNTIPPVIHLTSCINRTRPVTIRPFDTASKHGTVATLLLALLTSLARQPLFLGIHVPSAGDRRRGEVNGVDGMTSPVFWVSLACVSFRIGRASSASSPNHIPHGLKLFCLSIQPPSSSGSTISYYEQTSQRE